VLQNQSEHSGEEVSGKIHDMHSAEKMMADVVF
jgi:hypothetical protein